MKMLVNRSTGLRRLVFTSGEYITERYFVDRALATGSAVNRPLIEDEAKVVFDYLEDLCAYLAEQEQGAA